MASESPERLTRRQALTKVLAGVTAVGGLAGTCAAYNHWKQKRIEEQIRAALLRTEHQLLGLADDNIEKESIEISAAVPEARREARDVLMTMAYIAPEEGDWHRAFEYVFGPLSRALPAYSKVHIVTQDDLPAAPSARLAETLGGRDFALYRVMNTQEGGLYAQDIGEALGTKTADGQFQIVNSHFEMKMIRALKKGMLSQTSRPFTNPLMADALLAKHYPGQFKVRHVDAIFMGGNLSFGALPNGETCVFVSKRDIFEYLQHVMHLAPSDHCSLEQYQQAKAAFQQSFGTKNVVVVDEDFFLRELTQRPLADASLGSAFFHNDMVFFQHIVNDRPVMFVTDFEETRPIIGMDVQFNPEEEDFLRRVQEQFQALGFKVVPIPTFSNDLNFANVVAFTHAETKRPTVILPYYHFYDDSDEEAKPPFGVYINEVIANHMLRRLHERAFEKISGAGVHVIPASFEENNIPAVRAAVPRGNMLLTGDALMQAGRRGGFHCKVNLLT